MSHVICLMAVDADQATFTWSEGPASFKPYTLEGMVYKDFQEIAAEAREKLADLVQDYLLDEQGMPKSAFVLAEAGHELYQAMFQPGAEQARDARQVRQWLEQLAQQHEVDTLEVVVESPWSLPWNIIYDQEPDKEAFLSGDDNPDRWKPFWGLRYNLAGGRKVDPLRRMPLLDDPKVLLVVDPEIRDGLPDEQQQRLAEFAVSHKFKLVHSKDELQDAITAERPELLYWLSHASADALVLAGEEISPRTMRKLLRQDDVEHFGGVAFLNACQTAKGGATGSFFEAFHNVGFAGMIGTEHQTVDQFANPLGLDFLEAFLDRGEPVGSVLRKLRGRVPLGLLYGTYCPPDIRVGRGNVQDGLEIRQVHVQGVALSAGPAADEAATRTLPPLPDEPYRSLAYYDREDRALFAGRDDDIERFARMLDDASTRILMLHGESGVGKSSFLHAGVIPYLEEECLGYQFIRDWDADASKGDQGSVIFIRATNDLFGQLAQALCEFCARAYEYQTPLGEQVSADLPGVLSELIGDDVNQGILRSVLRSDPTILSQIMEAISKCLPFTAILVIDQGEEVFTLARTPEDQQRGRLALDMLRRTEGAAGDFKVIFALRTEHYGRVIDRLRRGLHDTGRIREYLLTDFGEDSLLEAICRPTATEPIPFTADVPFDKYGFCYAKGVAKEIAHRVVRYTALRRDSVLPLMQVICAQLYRLASHRADKTITLADLKTLGGIEGGMRSHVEGLLSELLKGHPLDKRPVQKLFTRLYLKQPDGTLTTALIPEDEVQKRWTGRMPFDELLRASLALRLLKVNTLRIGFEEERRYVSLGHDALANLAAEWDEELSRSERLRKNLKKAATWVSAAAALAFLIWFVASWVRKAGDAERLVGNIKIASPGQLLTLIREDLPTYRGWVDADLRKTADDENIEAKQRLNAGLALDSMKPANDILLAELWRKLRHKLPDDDLTRQTRFYAAVALAVHVGDTKEWSTDDLKFVADHLVASNFDYQHEFRTYLSPIMPKLSEQLNKIFVDTTRREGERTSAANALAEFAADKPEKLAVLSCEATPQQYGIVYDKLNGNALAAELAVKHESEVTGMLLKIIREPVAGLLDDEKYEDLGWEQKLERLGRIRAGAAITLIRLGNRKQALDVLRVRKDPEALTQFVHGCKARGLTSAELIECLQYDEMNVSQRYGILLALGEFDWSDVHSVDPSLAENLAESYRVDPSSAIHSATGWLLRSWKAKAEADRSTTREPDAASQALDAAVNLLGVVDHTPHEKEKRYDPPRKWFVMEITSDFRGQQQPEYFTFIVFEPNDFLMGSPDKPAEEHRDDDEGTHKVEFTKPFAICDREMTRAQYRHFVDHPDMSEASDDDDLPIKLPNWFEIVSCCRVVTAQAGMGELQYYQDVDPKKLPDGEGTWPKDWSTNPEQTGFRLPTEAEWERACRAGTVTRFSWGSASEWAGKYAWFAGNTEVNRPVAKQRPNLRGLFDMHGSALEWCHDFYSWDYYEKDEAESDPTGPLLENLRDPKDPERVLRGGGRGSVAYNLRSARRWKNSPATQWLAAGFRLCMFVPQLQNP